MVKNFLRMGTGERLRLVLFVLLFVGAVLLWPILFSEKVDGNTSASWMALWTPLWICDALGEEWSGGDKGWIRKWDGEKAEGGRRRGMKSGMGYWAGWIRAGRRVPNDEYAD